MVRIGAGGDAGRSLYILVALIVPPICVPMLPNRHAGHVAREALAEARGRHVIPGLSFRSPTAGYYEQILEQAKAGTGWDKGLYITGEFLLWRYKPDLDLVDSHEGPTVTNHQGFCDWEHTPEKPPGVHRVALLGDSVVRGYGVAIQDRFDKLFERRINAAGRRRWEVLNFAVTAYRVTQMLDVALEKASAYHPDIYMLVFTEATVGPTWASHIYGVAPSGLDLKYDFLRTVVAESGLQGNDSLGLALTKLAPYRLRVIQGVLKTLKTRADGASAHIVVVFVSGVEPPELIRPLFRGIRQCVEDTGIPVIDLLDTFDGAGDLEPLRNVWYDPHANSTGQRLIANNLFNKWPWAP